MSEPEEDNKNVEGHPMLAQCIVHAEKIHLTPLKPYHEVSHPKITYTVFDGESLKIREVELFPEHIVTEDPKTWTRTKYGVCSKCGHKVWIAKEIEWYYNRFGAICSCCFTLDKRTKEWDNLKEFIKKWGV